jgi:hypothetical protein
MPVLTADGNLRAIRTEQAWVGGGWICATVASVFTFFSTLIHCIAFEQGEEEVKLGASRRSDASARRSRRSQHVPRWRSPPARAQEPLFI